ncbi:DUF3221 domain-containing protein [Planococcus sp. 4-30]|uniref:DUF3221 domain-containing protein n=2 Tax=Planococcus TaxID=1372 RepID=UPI001CC02CD6|nr:DUF3221 domain-containing protein [Planococcus sp. 4-30]
MMKKILVLIGLLLLLSGCGTDEEPLKEPLANEEDPSAASGAGDKEAVRGREILVTLEQTADPVKRNEAAAAVKESSDFKEGYLGEPTEELAEDMAVQQIEAEAVFKAVEDIYKGNEGLEKAGVIFLENQTSGANQSGVWVGIKNPDERIGELAAILQKQVDAGEILAEPIYIYKSAHTRSELNDLMYQAGKIVKPMAEAHPNPESVSYSISADTITGAIEIGHNFLTEAQIDELKNAFPEREVMIEQEGIMVPAPGEPTVKYPEPAMTVEPSSEGSYIIDMEEDRFLAVEATPKDFSENGGQDEFYSAVHFEFKDAANLLEVGQRVKIEAAGPILESYPGQGRAVFVEVLPTYQPKSADLTEAEVVKRALKGIDQLEFGIPAIRSVTYHAAEDHWSVAFKSWEQETELTIEDEK